ncbi:MAG: hypothetical protein JNL98_04815 [Bryobacterales bacterium]|nr:hypothetical protein [Bryobacterales bacterium]
MRIFTAFALGLTALATNAFSQDCGNATLRGAYAYTVDVITTVDGKTFTNSDVGRIVFDGAGKLTFRAASTVNGSTTIIEGAGEYLVGTDCTMTGKAEGVEFDGVVVGAGSDFAIVVREPGLSRAGNGTKIEGQTCSASAVAGAFGYQGQGSFSEGGRVFSLSEVGVITFASSGRITGVYSASSGGQVERREISGTFEIGSDCTGNATYKIGDTNYLMNFVVASSGNTFYYSETSGGSTITGAGGRVNPR